MDTNNRNNNTLIEITINNNYNGRIIMVIATTNNISK